MIRKLLNIPFKSEKIIIDAEIKLISERCVQIALTENNEQIESKKTHDNCCPRCKNKDKNTIVDKISQVQGKGNIKSKFNLITGNVEYNLSIDTIPVNHCNACGNEWIKFKVETITEYKVLKMALKYLAQIYKNPDEKRFTWKVETIKIFDGCTAETIYQLYSKYKEYLLDNLSLSMLRKHYNSVYDLK